MTFWDFFWEDVFDASDGKRVVEKHGTSRPLQHFLDRSSAHGLMEKVGKIRLLLLGAGIHGNVGCGRVRVFVQPCLLTKAAEAFGDCLGLMVGQHPRNSD